MSANQSSAIQEEQKTTRFVKLGKDLTGKRVGRLLVLRIAPRIEGKRPEWVCKCDCGNEVTIKAGDLRRTKRNPTRSCGCFRRERMSDATGKHRMSFTAEYTIWIQMRRRCHDPRMDNFGDYGGRGIVVCERWRESFENFFEDMGKRPGAEFELDRKDNDGPYCKENCRWATFKQQARNRRNNRLVTYNGVSKILIEWCEELGLDYMLIWDRLDRGWTPERAFTEPVQIQKNLRPTG